MTRSYPIAIEEFDGELFAVDPSGVGINTAFIHMLIRLYEADEDAFLEIMEIVKDRLKALDSPAITA